MGDTLQSLHRLQTVERQLATIRRNREVKTKRTESLQRQIRQVDGRIEQFHRQSREQQAKIDALTLDITAREDSVARHREALNKAKTNKEYAAILAAMNTEKADNSKIEISVVQMSDEWQRIKNEEQAAQQERTKLQETLVAAQKALDDYDSSVAAERGKLLLSRQEFSKAINPVTLQSFLRVAEHHDGEAMAEVTKIHPKRDEYMCGGCNISVTLDMVNSLRTRDEIQPCRSCGRILYFESAPVPR